MIAMQRGPKITITCEVGEEFAPFLRRHLRASIAHLNRAPAVLSLAVVSAQTIGRLNRQFMGRRGPTDVLSFEISRDGRNRVTEAEIVICLDMAVRQARRRGHAVENELSLYALHGLLHLCGYDDTTPAEATRMHAEEDRILEAIGIGPVFAPAKPRRRGSRPAKAVAGSKASS